MRANPQGQNDLRLANTKLLLDIIGRHRPISRAGLVKLSHMSPTSVSRIVADLQNCGLVRETGEYAGGVGRRAVMLDLVPDALYTLGLAIDKGRIRLCLVNYLSEIAVQEERELAEADGEMTKLTRMALELYGAIMARRPVPAHKIIGMGISTVGVVDAAGRGVLLSPQFGWQNAAPADAFERAFRLPAIVENDVRASLVGEMQLLGIPRDTDAALLHIGSGVGSAASVRGAMLRGRQNAAGEVGHIITDRQNGLMCECGRRGCLQTHLAGRYLLERAQKAAPEVQSLLELSRRYAAGEGWAAALIGDCVEHICFALDILTGMYNPDCIIMGGSFFDYFTGLMPLVKACFKRRALLPLITTNRLMLSASLYTAGMLGAAIQARGAFLAAFLRRRAGAARPE